MALLGTFVDMDCVLLFPADQYKVPIDHLYPTMKQFCGNGLFQDDFIPPFTGYRSSLNEVWKGWELYKITCFDRHCHRISTHMNTYGLFCGSVLHNALSHHHLNTEEIIGRMLSIIPVQFQRRGRIWAKFSEAVLELLVALQLTNFSVNSFNLPSICMWCSNNNLQQCFCFCVS